MFVVVGVPPVTLNVVLEPNTESVVCAPNPVIALEVVGVPNAVIALTVPFAPTATLLAVALILLIVGVVVTVVELNLI